MMPNLGRAVVQTQRELMQKLPALVRCRYLHAMQTQLDGIQELEGLRHRCMDPDAAKVHAIEFRAAAEKLAEETLRATWVASAWRLFAVADPC